MITLFEKLHEVKERILNPLGKEKGAAAFEYLRVIGGVSAVILGAVAVWGAISFRQGDGRDVQEHR